MNPYAILGVSQQDSLKRGGLSALASLRVPVKNDTGSDIATKKLVYFSGYDAAAKRFEVALADADDPAKRAMALTDHAIPNGVSSFIVLESLIGGLDTSAGAVGDAVYESATAGAWALVAPTGADQEKLVVGRVKVVSSTVGVVHFNFGVARLEKVGSSFLQDGAVVAGALGTSSVTSAKIASLAVTSGKIGTSAVIAAKIGVSAVTAAKIASLAVTTGKIAANAVTQAKLSASLLVSTSTATMASGSATIADSAVKKSTAQMIVLSRVSTPVSPGALYVGAITSLTSFKVLSTAAGDASKIRYAIWTFSNV